MSRFLNKIAIVTGGCRGIGKAIVMRFLSEGAKVYALDYSIPGPNEVFIEDINLSNNVVVMQLDVTNAEQVDEVFSHINEVEGRIDFLINNAGITRDSLLMRMTESNWDSVLSTNLKGAFLCTKSATKFMMQKKFGRIVNIGSVVGIMGNAGQANYSASKAGLIGLTKSVAKELGSHNILVNYVAPGFVRTPMTDVLTEEQKNEFLKNIPLRRAAEPTDIANVVTFFCSDDANYLTGQILHIDGGMVM